MGGTLYGRMCSVVYALDLYSCVYVYEVITVEKCQVACLLLQ